MRRCRRAFLTPAAAVLRAFAEEAVEEVTTGPIRPSADAGPANVGEYTPKLDVVTVLA
jgi:hypothetical protein